MDLQPILQHLRGQLADLALREIEPAPGLDAALRTSRTTPAFGSMYSFQAYGLNEKPTPASWG